VRSLILEEIQRGERDPLPTDIAQRARESKKAIEDRYGPENLGPWDDWTWGYVNGKLAALWRVLGSEWDFLDT